MRVNVSGCVWIAFVCCCFACDCVLELVVCRVRFARVSCPRLRFNKISITKPELAAETWTHTRALGSAPNVAIYAAATPFGPHRHGVVVTAALCIAFCAAGLCAET